MISRKTLKVIVVVLTVMALVLASAAIALADPGLAVTVDPTAPVSRTGIVTLTGTVTCNVPMSIYVSGQLRQSVGRKTLLQAYFYSYPWCSGGTTPWSATVASSNGVFGGGKAEVYMTASGCSWYFCEYASVSQTIRLKPTK